MIILVRNCKRISASKIRGYENSLESLMNLKEIAFVELALQAAGWENQLRCGQLNNLRAHGSIKPHTARNPRSHAVA